jgi:signal peptidase II
MKRHIMTALIAATALGFDIITKVLVEKNIAQHTYVNVIGTFVQFTRLYNTGGVFGIAQGHKNVFLVISILVLIALGVFYYFEKEKTTLFGIAMGLIFGGACGNILDRLVGKIGVVDFIHIGVDGVYRWPAFNVADSCIVVGAGLLIILFIQQERRLRKAKLAE